MLPIVVLEELREKYLLFKPEYFVIDEGKEYEVKVLVLDESEVNSVTLYYSVNGKQKSVKMSKTTCLEIPNIQNINLIFYGCYGAKIPAQKAETYVEYYVEVVDKDNNKAKIPIGFYYVTKISGKKVLIVDPEMKLWFVAMNYRELKDTLEKALVYRMNVEGLSDLVDSGKKFERFAGKLITRKKWEMISDDFKILIVQPEQLREYLSRFNPDVVLISNTWLRPWDLEYTHDSLSSLISYLRKRNAELIVTHGSLYDQLVWTSCKRERAVRIGARGHVGDKIEVYNDKSLAVALGLYPLPLLEYAMDRLAESACNIPEVRYELSIAIGSTPLIVPYVPFSGNLLVEEEHEVTKGLGRQFNRDV